MPTSFSRIMDGKELDEVRNQYLAALEELEAEEAEADDDPASPDADSEPER